MISQPLVAIGLSVTLLLTACGRTSSDQPPAEPPPDKSPPPVASTSANVAAPNDCNAKIDASAAANILGVPNVSAIPYRGHSQMSPDNMDLLPCGYADASPNPMGPTLQYDIYTPQASDIESVYNSGEENHPNMEKFPTQVGMGSAGWVSPGDSDLGFNAYIVFRTATNVFRIRASGLPSADAAEKAVLKIASMM